jgi:DnaJ-class molecular chaperone
MNVNDYYGVLEVSRNAGHEDIRTAFRRLAIQYHPDHNPERTEEAKARFKELNEAYEVLGDTYKRWQYDRLISVSDYARRAAFAENSANKNGQADHLPEMLRKLGDLRLATGSGCRKPWGYGRRKGRQCRCQ